MKLFLIVSSWRILELKSLEMQWWSILCSLEMSNFFIVLENLLIDAVVREEELERDLTIRRQHRSFALSWIVVSFDSATRMFVGVVLRSPRAVLIAASCIFSILSMVSFFLRYM